MPRGKLIITNTEKVETSSFVSAINLSKTELITFAGNVFQIQFESGEKVRLDHLSITEVAEISEFMAAYTAASEDQVIHKHIVISSIA